MIGFYDYTVILTYLSLLSAVTGIGLAVAPPPAAGNPLFDVQRPLRYV